MIRVTPYIVINEDEIKEVFIRASGPGGQNVNKVATAVQLRFDVRNSSLPDEVKERLIKLGGKRINEKGVLCIEAKRFRTQERNRLNARERLVNLLLRASQDTKKRKKTRPTMSSVEHRISEKKIHGKMKKMRQPLKKDSIQE
jgi:ribosome-associated protein